MPKWMIMALLCLPLAVIEFDAQAESFDYTPTAPQSKSNYQRIGLIDNYLKSLQSNISRMRMEMDRKYTTGDKNILHKITALENMIDILKIEVQSLSKSKRQHKKLSTSQEKSSKSMAEMEIRVDENATKIEVLQTSFRQMNNTLVSIEDLLKTYKETNKPN